MRRMLKWLGTAVVAVAAIVVLAWLTGRASGPGHMQREALALMQTPWAAPGSNAFDALWLLPYPVADADNVANAKVARRTLGKVASLDFHEGRFRHGVTAARTADDDAPPVLHKLRCCCGRDDLHSPVRGSATPPLCGADR